MDGPDLCRWVLLTQSGYNLWMFELSLLHELAAGRHDPLQVGELPVRVLEHFGCRLPWVYLSKETFDKIMRKHGHVTFFDVLILPEMLRKGRYVADRRNAVAVCYRHPETDKDFAAAVKITADAFELYVTTVHRAERKQVERIMRRGREI